MKKERLIQELYSEPNLIGVESYELEKALGKGWESMLNQLRPHFSEVAPLLQSRMHNNCNLGYDERPASAFYVILDKELVVIWGKVNSVGIAKVHEHLRASDEYLKVSNKCNKLFSGHLGTVEIPGLPRPIKVALFDSIRAGDRIDKTYNEFPAIVTVIVNGIVPVTTDGYVVDLIL